MIQLSLWTKQHKWQSWILIVSLHLLATGIAFFLGNALYFEGYSLSSNWVIVFIILPCFILLFYPIQGLSGMFKPTFIKRKSYQMLMLLSGFMLILAMSNLLTATTIQEDIQSRKKFQILKTVLIPQSPKLTFEQKTKHWIKQNNKEFTKHFTLFWDQQSNREQNLYLVLTTCIGFLTIVTTASLSYSLSHSSIKTLGITIGIMGLLSIFIVSILVIRQVIKTNFKRT